jgi:hypothetical protein
MSVEIGAVQRPTHINEIDVLVHFV